MKVRWEAEHEDSFRSLIHLLGKSTILRLPNFDKEFVVRTDATDTLVLSCYRIMKITRFLSFMLVRNSQREKGPTQLLRKNAWQ